MRDLVEDLRLKAAVLESGGRIKYGSYELLYKAAEEIEKLNKSIEELENESHAQQERIEELEEVIQNIVNSEVLGRVVDNSYYEDAVKALKGGDL